MSIRKQGSFVVGVVFISVSLAACVKDPDKPRWPGATIDWPLDHTGADTVRLRIPPGYNLGVAADAMERLVYPDGRPHDPHNIEADMLLETLWPRMGPRTRRNDEEFKRRGGGRTLTILVKSGAIDPKVHAIDRLHRSLNATMSVYLSRICVPRKQRDNTCFDLEELSSKPDRFGLKHVGVNFAQYPKLAKDSYYRYKDIYYTPELDDSLETYISCNPEEAEPFSRFGYPLSFQCDQTFIFKPLNALVSVNYRRVYLGEWDKIHSAVKKLLQSFIAKR